MSKVQAVILAGGAGSRLRPYTTVLPKPLMPVGEWPIAEIIVRQFKHYGIERLVISTGHLAGLIESYFGDGKRWGVDISYVHETNPLGTAGAIRLVKNLADDFLLINGDVLTDMNFRELLQFHKKQRSAATIAVKERVVKTDFGVIMMGPDQKLEDYIEKPEHRSFVSMGINVMKKKCQDYIKKNESIGIPELMLRLKASGEAVHCYPTKKQWLDLGRPDDLEAAQETFHKLRKRFLPSS